jgi:quinol monooxygenase YgiN
MACSLTPKARRPAEEAEMIFIVVKQRVRSKFADDWPSLVEEFTTATRAEPGNISFEWFRSAEDPNVWVLVEMFRDEEAGKVHVESEHFKKATGQLSQWLAAVPEIIHVDRPGDGWDTMSEVS